jgi:hypothetical protein
LTARDEVNWVCCAGSIEEKGLMVEQNPIVFPNREERANNHPEAE